MAAAGPRWSGKVGEVGGGSGNNRRVVDEAIREECWVAAMGNRVKRIRLLLC